MRLSQKYPSFSGCCDRATGFVGVFSSEIVLGARRSEERCKIRGRILVADTTEKIHRRAKPCHHLVR